MKNYKRTLTKKKTINNHTYYLAITISFLFFSFRDAIGLKKEVLDLLGRKVVGK